MGVHPSSTTPLQLLSRPSQVSGDGCTFDWHAFWPPTHGAVVPAAHTPSSPLLQAIPPPGLPSSTTPSQLSSIPLHDSGPGRMFWLQAITPAIHAVVPAAQAPGLP